MSLRKRFTLVAAMLALAVFGIACSSGSTSTLPSPTATRPEASPTATVEAVPLTPVLTPSAEVLQFLGPTIAFEFPENWYLLQRSYESGEETVVLANIDREAGGAGLPSGAIRIEFTGKQGGELGAAPGEVKETFDISGIRFTLTAGEEVPWTLRGSFLIGGVNFRYVALVQMNTPEPQMEVLTPILESWVVGSTNNHPARTCISPVECP